MEFQFETILEQDSIDILGKEYLDINNVTILWSADCKLSKDDLELIPNITGIKGEIIEFEYEKQLTEDHFETIEYSINVIDYEIQVDIESARDSLQFKPLYLVVDTDKKTLTVNFGGF